MTSTTKNAPLSLLLVAILLTGCTVGPNYKRPQVNAPTVYRGLTPDQAATTDPASLGDEKWSEVFQDEQLRELIKTALQQNYDVLRAGARVLQAQASLGITRSNQFPTINGVAAATNERTAREGIFPAIETNTNQIGGTFAWEIDFWGKFRRATEAARANLAASEWAQREIMAELVENVAGGYFTLRALDMQLDISRRTLASRQDSLRLTQLLANGGSTSLLDVRQAEQLVYTAGSEIPSLEQQIEQEENFLSILLGNNPGPITRGKSLTEQPIPPTVPAGLPSSLLQRRPDILQAEQQLIAANAEIGVARSQYFPQITLTADAGFQSSALTGLFQGPAGFWSFGSNLAQPIFTAGRLKSNVRLSEAQQQEAVFFYQETIQGAFRDVSDALIAYRKTQEFSQQQKLLVDSAQDATRLSHLRYSGGATSYLEVLTNDTNYFTAELGLVQAQLNEQLALVQLYKGLGGGWQR